jgi:hypothetical protein
MYPSRIGNSSNYAYRTANAADAVLTGEVRLYTNIINAGGLQKICCPSKYVYDKPPYLVMPPEARQYQEINSIPLPANNGTDTLVNTFKVPTGYDGVITSIAHYWTGAGLVEGSGDLVWRVKIQNHWARNLGNINTTLGSLTSPCPLFRGGIRLTSQQTINYYVNHAVASGLAGGRIVCAVFGWFYAM